MSKIAQVYTTPSSTQPTGIAANRVRLAQLRASLEKATTEEQKLNIQQQIDALQEVVDKKMNATFNPSRG
jgi:hypothetical protein